MIEEYVGVLELVVELRKLQRQYQIDVLSATFTLRRQTLGLAVGDQVTLRFNGVETPICEIEDDQGHAFTFMLPPDDADC